jgi:hypothetical protein
LIAITITGGLIVFAVWNSMAGTSSKKTQVNFDYMALYKSVGEPKAIFAATLKNAGNKPIVSLTIKLHNESTYNVPSVTVLTPLEPGDCVGVTLTPPTIHDDWYIIGNFYLITIVRAEATDGSSFSHTTSVMCMGQEGPAGMVAVTFQAVGLGSSGPLLDVNERTYTAEELSPEYTLTLKFSVGQSVTYAWYNIVASSVPDARSRWNYSTGLATERSSTVIVPPAGGKLTAFYIKQFMLQVNVEEGGTADPAPGEYWFDQNQTVNLTALPSTDWQFVQWTANLASSLLNPTTIVMNESYVATAYFGKGFFSLEATCPSFSTSSLELVDDPNARLEFTLPNNAVVLVMLSACNVQGDTESYLGKEVALTVDGVDVATAQTSPYSNNYANGAFLFWIGELSAGNHTVKARVASISGGTVTISERRLTVTAFNPDLVTYYYDRSTVSVDYSPPVPPDAILETIYPSPAYQETTLVESPHPYPNNYNETWVITRAGAQSMQVHFEYIKVENYYDYVYIMDENDSVVAAYSNFYTDLWTPWVAGDTIKIRLTSDSSVQYDGFVVDMFNWSPVAPLPYFAESPHPYPNNYNETWVITRAGAQSMQVHFEYIKVENYYDYVYIMDENDSVVAAYSNFYTDLWTPWVAGDTIKIRLTSDSSVQYDGFAVDAVRWSTQPPQPFMEDPEAKANFTLAADKKALVLYAVTNYNNVGEDEYGKAVALFVDDALGSPVATSPGKYDGASSVFIAEIHSLTAGSHVIQGAFGSTTAQKVTISERQLGILFFNSTLQTDYTDSSVQTSHDTTALTDDEAVINRTVEEVRYLMAVYVAGKNSGTESSKYGKKVAVNVDGVDYGLNAQSPLASDHANTAAIHTPLLRLSAGTHVVKGRFASNSEGYPAKVDERKLVALWFPTETFVIMVPAVKTLTVTIIGDGVTDPPSGTHRYIIASPVNFTATPLGDYTFMYWIVNGEPLYCKDLCLKITFNYNVTAVFSRLFTFSYPNVTGTFDPDSTHQHRSFEDVNGYFYLFIYDQISGNVIYTSTSDRQNWMQPAEGNPVVLGDFISYDARYFDIVYDASMNKVYVVAVRRLSYFTTEPLYLKIKEGTPSNGTISFGDWVVAASMAQDPDPTYFTNWGPPSICKSGNGYFWIIFPCSDHNQRIDTWYMHSLNPNDITSWQGPATIYDWQGGWWALNVPLANGCYQMYSSSSNGIVYGRVMTDSGDVGSWEQVTPKEGFDVSAVVDSQGNIHVVYRWLLWGWAQGIGYVERVNGTWSEEQVLYDGTVGAPVMSIQENTTQLYVVYSIGSNLYLQTCENGIWSDRVLVMPCHSPISLTAPYRVGTRYFMAFESQKEPAHGTIIAAFKTTP